MTRHKVAIKILNRRKIQAMDMEEKGTEGPGEVVPLWTGGMRGIIIAAGLIRQDEGRKRG